MPTVPINLIAVFAAALASFVLGSIWYGPLFGKAWMKLMGMNKDSMDKAKMKGMYKSYALMALGAFVMAYVLAHSLVFATTYLRISGVDAGLQAGLWSWLGFVAPICMGAQLWEGKPWKLFCIQGGYYLVSLCMMGVILSLWK